MPAIRQQAYPRSRSPMFESRSLPQDANGCKTPKSPFEPKSHEASSIKIVKSPIHLKRIHLRIYTYDLHRTVSKLSIPSFRAPPTGADKPAAHESHVQGLGTQALCCDMAESNPIQPDPTLSNPPQSTRNGHNCLPTQYVQSMFHGSIHVKFNTYSNVFNTCLLHPNPACSSQKSSPRPRKASRRYST